MTDVLNALRHALVDTDTADRVWTFAQSYIYLLDQRIAAEQRRSEENIEMRKRMYGDPGDEDAA